MLTLTEEKKFRQPLTIPCYAADKDFSLRPTAFMDYAQEIAYLAASRLGFGYEAVTEHHTAWVLSRMSIDFINPPKWRDNVSLDTWHKGTDGLFFLRDFEVKDKDENVLIAATSSWLIIDMQTRRLVRSDEMQKVLTFDVQCTADALPEPAPKLSMPKDVEKEILSPHVVLPSDMDFNGHTNNVRYAAWSIDCIPAEILASRPIRHLNISFTKETTLSEPVSLTRACVEEGETLRYIIEGTVGGKQAFITEIVL